MVCEFLSSIIVATKNSGYIYYSVDTGITFEELDKFLKERHKDNIDKVMLGPTLGYLHKE